jgi:predicted Zn finger-like uncharacterized protein
MYTQCPACKTVFNVKPEQLRAARGKVRCSRCQTIFNAAEHSYTPESSASKPAKPTPTASAGATASKPQAATPKKTQTTKSTAKQPPRPKPTPAAEPVQQKKPAATQESHDDGWFDLTPGPASKPKPSATKPKTPKEPPQSESPANKEPTSVEDELNDDLFNLFAEQEVAEAITLEETPATAAQEPTGETDASDKPAAKEAKPAAPHKDDKKDGKKDKPREKQPEEKKKADGGSYSLPPQLEARPVRATMRTFTYMLSNLMLVAALGTQYAYSHRIALQENETLRPWLDTLCQITACPLPPRRDLDKIELVDNMMQSHPRYQDSLLITATLINRADYVQPYPIVEITMTDLQQKMVAQRTFRPEEYLAGDIAEMGFTPNVEVALMLEVTDPGNNAVGFKFDFY